MTLLTQAEAKARIARLNEMAELNNLTQLQAIEAIELPSDLSYSYIRQGNYGNDPDNSLRDTACELGDKRDELAKEYDVCWCCFQPGHVCRCGQEHDDCYHPQDLWTAEDDINCWYND